MSITRMSPAILDMEENRNGEYIRHCDYLAVIEELEYEIRYEREQKEEAQEVVQDLMEQIIELKTSLKVALDEVDRQAVEINEYVDAQPPI